MARTRYSSPVAEVSTTTAGRCGTWCSAASTACPVPDDAVVVGDHHADRPSWHRHPNGERRAAPRCAADLHGTAEFGDPVPDVDQSGVGVRGGRVEAGAGVPGGRLDVPVLAGLGLAW